MKRAILAVLILGGVASASADSEQVRRDGPDNSRICTNREIKPLPPPPRRKEADIIRDNREADERERKWTEYCKPTNVGAYGMSYYRYAHPGCAWGESGP